MDYQVDPVTAAFRRRIEQLDHKGRRWTGLERINGQELLTKIKMYWYDLLSEPERRVLDPLIRKSDPLSPDEVNVIVEIYKKLPIDEEEQKDPDRRRKHAKPKGPLSKPYDPENVPESFDGSVPLRLRGGVDDPKRVELDENEDELDENEDE